MWKQLLLGHSAHGVSHSNQFPHIISIHLIGSVPLVNLKEYVIEHKEGNETTDDLDFLPGDEATEKPPSIFNNVANQPGYKAGDLMEKFMENKIRLITVK